MACRLRPEMEGTMENAHAEELRTELLQLLKKQEATMDSRMLGTASDAELLEYELRQELINEICEELSQSQAA